MPTIKDATIKQHDTFRFVTYNFKDLNITINKTRLITFLKFFYKAMTTFEVDNTVKEIKQIQNSEIQYILFYGNFEKRKGFEYIYRSKDSTPESTSSFYIFEQTIAENFHLYFNLADKKEPLNPKRTEHTIEEIVVYMAQFHNKEEKFYEDTFNRALLLIEEFISQEKNTTPAFLQF
jgi:hypothetical protein